MSFGVLTLNLRNINEPLEARYPALENGAEAAATRNRLPSRRRFATRDRGATNILGGCVGREMQSVRGCQEQSGRAARHAGHSGANRKAAAAGVQSAPATKGWPPGLRLRQQKTRGTRRLRSYKEQDDGACGARRWPCPRVEPLDFSCRSTTDPANPFRVLVPSWGASTVAGDPAGSSFPPRTPLAGLNIHLPEPFAKPLLFWGDPGLTPGSTATARPLGKPGSPHYVRASPWTSQVNHRSCQRGLRRARMERQQCVFASYRSNWYRASHRTEQKRT
jgi:hypothetical protein